MTAVENINGFVRTVRVEEPRLGNNTADVERVQAALVHSLGESNPSRKNPLVFIELPLKS